MGGAGKTAGADNKKWLTTSSWTESTAATNGRVWIIAYLGAVWNPGTINLWNFQWKNGATDLSDRGVSQFDILVHNTARFVAIRVDSYYGGGLGLGKVRFQKGGC